MVKDAPAVLFSSAEGKPSGDSACSCTALELVKPAEDEIQNHGSLVVTNETSGKLEMVQTEKYQVQGNIDPKPIQTAKDETSNAGDMEGYLHEQVAGYLQLTVSELRLVHQEQTAGLLELVQIAEEEEEVAFGELELKQTAGEQTKAPGESELVHISGELEQTAREQLEVSGELSAEELEPVQIVDAQVQDLGKLLPVQRLDHKHTAAREIDLLNLSQDQAQTTTDREIVDAAGDWELNAAEHQLAQTASDDAMVAAKVESLQTVSVCARYSSDLELMQAAHTKESTFENLEVLWPSESNTQSAGYLEHLQKGEWTMQDATALDQARTSMDLELVCETTGDKLRDRDLVQEIDNLTDATEDVEILQTADGTQAVENMLEVIKAGQVRAGEDYNVVHTGHCTEDAGNVEIVQARVLLVELAKNLEIMQVTHSQVQTDEDLHLVEAAEDWAESFVSSELIQTVRNEADTYREMQGMTRTKDWAGDTRMLEVGQAGEMESLALMHTADKAQVARDVEVLLKERDYVQTTEDVELMPSVKDQA
uniref:uncharacterized protein n=1 Tax=Myxine glutinosa TaxID=7769 RepID=UPI00358F77E9